MHRSLCQSPIPIHMPKCAYSQRFVNCPRPFGDRFLSHAECGKFHIEKSPMKKQIKLSIGSLCQIQCSITWMQMEMIIPMNVISRNGTKMNHMNDDSKRAQSHTNAAATRIIIRIGSWAMVIENIASGGPNARNAQPKNSGKVILLCGYWNWCDVQRN